VGVPSAFGSWLIIKFMLFLFPAELSYGAGQDDV